jgi:hypothetical protein
VKADAYFCCSLAKKKKELRKWGNCLVCLVLYDSQCYHLEIKKGKYLQLSHTMRLSMSDRSTLKIVLTIEKWTWFFSTPHKILWTSDFILTLNGFQSMSIVPWIRWTLVWTYLHSPSNESRKRGRISGYFRMFRCLDYVWSLLWTQLWKK